MVDVYKRQGVSGEEGNIQFLYTNAAFAGAKYKIYAAEDIYSQDKQTKIYQAGDLAGELETKEDGSCSSDMLHLGTYKVVEQQAPDSLTIGQTEEELSLIHIFKILKMYSLIEQGI